MRIAMRIALIILTLALLVCNVQGIMYLTSGSDAYGKGLSYPGYKDPPAIASFVAGDHTSRLAPVFLGATLYRPEFANISSINRSFYYRFLDPWWHYSSLPANSLSANYPDWSALGMEHGVYDAYVPAVKEFVQTSWKPAPLDYQTPGHQEFMQEDWEPPELVQEDYPGIDAFLKTGEDAPKRHLI